MEINLLLFDISEETKKELKDHLKYNGYYSTYSIENNIIVTDIEEVSYIITILNDRNIDFIIRK